MGAMSGIIRMDPDKFGIRIWMGLSKEEFEELKKERKGICLRCDKTIRKYRPLCSHHIGAFHRWQQKKMRETGRKRVE